MEMLDDRESWEYKIADGARALNKFGSVYCAYDKDGMVLTTVMAPVSEVKEIGVNEIDCILEYDVTALHKFLEEATG